MGKPSKEIQDFMNKYGVRDDERWLLPGGKSWAIKYKALSRIAIQLGIKWDEPREVEMNSGEGIAVIRVKGFLGDKEAFDYGEASPKNNKNAYPVAMAIKRGKGRVILMLVSMHGDVYSEHEDFVDEVEASEWKQPRQNPHVTRPEDIYEKFDDAIPSGGNVNTLRKDSRPLLKVLRDQLERIDNIVDLDDWARAPETCADAEKLKPDDKDTLRGELAKKREELIPSNILAAG